MKVLVQIDANFYGDEEEHDELEGPVVAMFSHEGEMWIAFTLPDMGGVQVISTGSRFYLGLKHEGE